MELDKLLEGLEKYLREFILYILSFFRLPHSGESSDTELEQLNKTALFSVFSAILGAFLWDRYISEGTGKIDDLAGVIADRLMLWLSCGVVFHYLLAAFRIRIRMIVPILIILKIFSVSHLVAIYAAYMIRSIIGFFSPLHGQWAGPLAYIIELAILIIYLRRELFLHVEVQPRRRAAYCAWVTMSVILFVIVMTPIVENRNKTVTPAVARKG